MRFRFLLVWSFIAGWLLVAGVAAFIMLMVGGLNYRLDREGNWMGRFLRVDVRQPSLSDARARGLSRDIVLPKSVIAVCSFLGLIAASVMACFLYYPPRSEIRKEMVSIQADLNGDCAQYEWDKIAYWIPILEDWAHKLEVSDYLRRSPLTRFQQMKMHVFLSKLELLEHAAEDHEKQEVDEWKRAANLAFIRFTKSLD